jgi:hypothetical protein
MKKVIAICSVVLLSVRLFSQSPTINITNAVQVPWEQKMTAVFQNVDLSAVSSHVLIDHGIVLCPIDNFDPGTIDNSKACSFPLWQRLYGTLFSSAWESQHRLPAAPIAYLNIANGVTESQPIPFAILSYNYHQIEPSAFNDNLLTVSNEQLYDVPNRPRSPYESHSCFASVPMLEKIHALQSQFVFRQDLYFSNNGKTISSVEVDFADGLSWRTVQWGVPIGVNYSFSGEKFITTRINYSDNSIVENKSRLLVDVVTSTSAGRYNQIFQQFHFSGTRQFNGSAGGALITIALGCGNVELTKPLIVVEGFDPPQRPYENQNHFEQYVDKITFSWTGISGNPVNLGNDLESQGYDLVFIDFDNGGDYIQRSAYLVEEVIEWVNAQLSANGSNHQNVVWGVSNGGLIARYALRETDVAITQIDVSDLGAGIYFYRLTDQGDKSQQGRLFITH